MPYLFTGFIHDYGVALKRLKCFYQDEYYGIAPNLEQRDFNPEPPVFACQFSSVPGCQELLALGNEDGKIVIQDITRPSDRKQIEGTQALIQMHSCKQTPINIHWAFFTCINIGACATNICKCVLVRAVRIEQTILFAKF